MRDWQNTLEGGDLDRGCMLLRCRSIRFAAACATRPFTDLAVGWAPLPVAAFEFDMSTELQGLIPRQVRAPAPAQGNAVVFPANGAEWQGEQAEYRRVRAVGWDRRRRRGSRRRAFVPPKLAIVDPPLYKICIPDIEWTWS